ncbi:MAG TPA: NUDIX domain-containing protein [Segetibacter sp.]
METSAEIVAMLEKYVADYPKEKEGLSQFIQFVQEFEGAQLFDRKNFTGHITASAFIIQPENTLLLLKHKSLNKWLQPGGHVDSTDPSLLMASLREVEEETGISAQDLVPVVDSVFDVDSHYIPENVRKQEKSHYHHDIRFLFTTLQTTAVNFAKDEADDSDWLPFAEVEKIGEFSRVINKIELLKQVNSG